MFAKQDLVARHHGAVQIVPDGGFLLVVAHVEGDEESSQTYIGWIGLAAEPTAKEMRIEGVMEDKRSEFGHRSGIQTHYEIHGTITSGKGKKLELELASTQQPHMFDPESPLHHITVAAQRLEDPAKCVFEKQKR